MPPASPGPQLVPTAHRCVGHGLRRHQKRVRIIACDCMFAEKRGGHVPVPWEHAYEAEGSRTLWGEKSTIFSCTLFSHVNGLSMHRRCFQIEVFASAIFYCAFSATTCRRFQTGIFSNIWGGGGALKTHTHTHGYRCCLSSVFGAHICLGRVTFTPFHGLVPPSWTLSRPEI